MTKHLSLTVCTRWRCWPFSAGRGAEVSWISHWKVPWILFTGTMDANGSKPVAVLVAVAPIDALRTRPSRSSRNPISTIRRSSAAETASTFLCPAHLRPTYSAWHSTSCAP
jgi:hypothetical protein